MFITTTHWDTGPELPEAMELEAKCREMTPDFESTKVLNFLENNSITVTRTWPTQEVADAWCTYVLAKGATSCVSEPYTP